MRVTRETVRTLLQELKSAESVARVLDLPPDVVRAYADARRRSSPMKGVKRGPAQKWWAKPGRAQQARCMRGHALEGANVIVRANGSRACRECHRARVRENEKKRGPRDRAAERERAALRGVTR